MDLNKTIILIIMTYFNLVNVKTAKADTMKNMRKRESSPYNRGNGGYGPYGIDGTYGNSNFGFFGSDNYPSHFDYHGYTPYFRPNSYGQYTSFPNQYDSSSTYPGYFQTPNQNVYPGMDIQNQGQYMQQPNYNQGQYQDPQDYFHGPAQGILNVYNQWPWPQYTQEQFSKRPDQNGYSGTPSNQNNYQEPTQNGGTIDSIPLQIPDVKAGSKNPNTPEPVYPVQGPHKANPFPDQSEGKPNDNDSPESGFILGRPVLVPRDELPSDEITFPDSSTETPTRRQCVQDCKSTSEYDPVCGSNNITYFNPSKFLCAHNCGVRVFVHHKGRCNDKPNMRAL